MDVTRVRSQFPSLSQVTTSGNPPIFFDNPAGTQVPQNVMQAVTDYYMTMNANGGGKFATSFRNDAMLDEARAIVADFLNAPSADEIVFGANMTTLNFALSRAIGKTLQAGDEIVLTRMDHDGNVAPWLHLAEDNDLVVRWIDFDPNEGVLDLDSFAEILTDRTRLVATVHASNALGTINPVQQIAGMAHEVGALHVVDAVQSTPHVGIDVQQIGCDFLLCSAYKFFGPHIGVLWGKYDLLSSLPAYKVRPSKNKTPWRWETGTPSFETINAVKATIEYVEWIGKEFGGDYDVPYDGRREVLKQAMAAMQAYEQSLVIQLIAGLQSVPGVHIIGITDPERVDERVPTVIFEMDSHTPEQIATYLGEHDIYVWDGDYYAVEVMKRLTRHKQGMVRVGLAHYNTPAEVDRLIEVLQSLP